MRRLKTARASLSNSEILWLITVKTLNYLELRELHSELCFSKHKLRMLSSKQGKEMPILFGKNLKIADQMSHQRSGMLKEISKTNSMMNGLN